MTGSTTPQGLDPCCAVHGSALNRVPPCALIFQLQRNVYLMESPNKFNCHSTSFPEAGNRALINDEHRRDLIIFTKAPACRGGPEAGGGDGPEHGVRTSKRPSKYDVSYPYVALRPLLCRSADIHGPEHPFISPFAATCTMRWSFILLNLAIAASPASAASWQYISPNALPSDSLSASCVEALVVALLLLQIEGLRTGEKICIMNQCKTYTVQENDTRQGIAAESPTSSEETPAEPTPTELPIREKCAKKSWKRTTNLTIKNFHAM
ncbi:hypothetical protein SODALDRAFT_361534 [Sodiomyces alkalinus F11]|uniref:Uncharacterized protein n=1 Tax=Sodiomyces alkalinus (strain CBS 110278 / VKM F-3762 / F11) TaxID=1314773 RepID=A0A3N2PQB3_SODAK|nr:hypothetical protein SODALDRAFT_361534 [Sodiomyces alkalinus F11]ROT36711.1 hypothetical protein SODALDRAFT_361534 [Sodiomyces alkalinus F11]